MTWRSLGESNPCFSLERATSSDRSRRLSRLDERRLRVFGVINVRIAGVLQQQRRPYELADVGEEAPRTGDPPGAALVTTAKVSRYHSSTPPVASTSFPSSSANTARKVLPGIRTPLTGRQWSHGMDFSASTSLLRI